MSAKVSGALENKSFRQVVAFFVLMVIALVMRFVPHVPNFSALTALALIAGITLQNRFFAIALPLLTVAISDVFFGSYPGMSFVYLSYVLVVLLGLGLGSILRSKDGLFMKGVSTGVALLSSAVIFYSVSNLGVWLYSGLYPKDFLGLVDCYLLAIPFFKNTLMSHLVFSMTFWLSHFAIEKFISKSKELQYRLS